MNNPFLMPHQAEVNIIHEDNMLFDFDENFFDVVFADYVYENLDFSWAKKYWNHLKTNGIFIAMTDHHSMSRFDVFMLDELSATPVNQIVWKNEWGNFPKNKFRQCHDYILIYCKGNDWHFDPYKAQVEKATSNAKGLNPSGRKTKLATSWIDDICLTTTSKERIKKSDGHLIRWQKPVSLINRVVAPFVRVGDKMVDPFLGSGTSAIAAMQLGLNFWGIEKEEEPYGLAVERIQEFDNRKKE